MPVTIHPASHDAKPLRHLETDASSDTQHLLETVTGDEVEKCKEILQDSFGDSFEPGSILGRGNCNGFVHAAIAAYSDHNCLVIRPDDVWVAILSQFSIYVNTNAESLRSLFVSHSGRVELVVRRSGNRYSVDFGKMAMEMTELLEKNVSDPDLRAWIMQDFSTTTPNDRVAMASMMMGTLQKYFSYKFELVCGIPTVTLLGEKKDWEQILDALRVLPNYGEDTTRWAQLLEPVLRGFVATFEKPQSEAVKYFWQRIADRSSHGSGSRSLSGWITAFCFWDRLGKCLHHPQSTNRTNFDNYGHKLYLELEGIPYHYIDSDDIPPGWVSTPIKVDDNGYEFNARMVAGNVAMAGTRSKANGELDTIQSVVGWWMYEVDEEGTAEMERKQEEIMEYERSLTDMWSRPSGE